MKQTEKPKKTSSLAMSFVMVLTLLVFVSIGHAGFKLPLQTMLIAAAIAAAFIGLKWGWTWAELERGICARIAESLPVIFIMFIVGFFIGALIYSGSIPMLIYYGLKMLSPRYLIASSFLICAVLSTATGTSWGSAGTAGVALIGVAAIMDLPLAPVAGAIVAGATFGDKLSPLSDTTILAALASGTELYKHVKSMLWTTLPSTAIALVIYVIYGMQFATAGQSPEHIVNMLRSMAAIYKFNVVLLLPFIIIFIGSLLKKPTLPILLLASATSLLLGIFYQGFPMQSGFIAGATGFKIELLGIAATDVPKEILVLLQRGGLSSMSSIVLTILCAYCFVGIAEKTGALQTCVDWSLRKVKSRGGTVAVSVISTIILTIICTVSYLSSIIIGQVFRKPYLSHRLDLCNLSRTTEDGGTMISSIIPFSNSGLFYFAALGVSPAVYFPWQILAFLCPVFAIIYGYTGIGMKKLTKEEADWELARHGFTTTNEEVANSHETQRVID